MSRRPRRNHASAFKAKVAIAAIKALAMTGTEVGKLVGSRLGVVCKSHLANPLVSVIIPTFNRAHVIGRAIKSVLAQTFQDFEIIVVDDGSRDETAKRAIELARSELRIRIFRFETNQGAQAARNAGASRTR